MSHADALSLLRTSIASNKSPLLTTTSEPSEAVAAATESFSQATHLYFPYPIPQCLPLTSATRFTSTTPDTSAVDLRSIWFAWVQKDVTVSEYIAAASELDKSLPDGQNIRNLVFVERIDLITWLEGATDESEYIKLLEDAPGTAGAAAKAAEITGGVGVPAVQGSGVASTQQTSSGRPTRVIDVRLQAIYNGERKMGDHNSALRGIKPTVRSRRPPGQDSIICTILTCGIGFLPRSQTLRDIPRSSQITYKQFSSRCFVETPPQSPSASHRQTCTQRFECQTCRPHHSSLAVRFIFTTNE